MVLGLGSWVRLENTAQKLSGKIITTVLYLSHDKVIGRVKLWSTFIFLLARRSMSAPLSESDMIQYHISRHIIICGGAGASTAYHSDF